MSASRALLLTSLTTYYNTNPDQRKLLFSIINGESKLSLRILDWFVTHYARMNNVTYYIDTSSKPPILCAEYPKEGGGAHIRKFNLYLDYRKQLQSYTKMFFDPFRRHERISFVIEETPLTVIETTIGQLNFFKWALETQVFTYVLKHLQDIETHMATFHKSTNSRAANNTKCVAIKKDIPHTLYHGICHVSFN